MRFSFFDADFRYLENPRNEQHDPFDPLKRMKVGDDWLWSLGGEVRPVGQVERRLAEAARMGFTTAYLAPRAVPRTTPAGLRAIGIEDVRGLVGHLFS